MTNINLRPGSAGSLEDLIADTDDGIYVETNKSWSIDDRRLNFQFGTQAGWIIKNGKRTQLVKNPTYTGITPQFWGELRRHLRTGRWTLWGLPELRQGRADADRPCRPRRRPGPLPQRAGGSGDVVSELHDPQRIDALLDHALGAMRWRRGGGDLPRAPTPP